MIGVIFELARGCVKLSQRMRLDLRGKDKEGIPSYSHMGMRVKTPNRKKHGGQPLTVLVDGGVGTRKGRNQYGQ